MRRLWISVFVAFVLSLVLSQRGFSGNPQESPRIDAGRIMARLEALGEIGKTAEGGVSRPAFSPDGMIVELPQYFLSAKFQAILQACLRNSIRHVREE